MKAQAFQDDLIDLEKANIVTRLGIVEFGVESNGVNWQDIRFIGLESGDLVVRPSPNWQNEQPETREKLEKWIIPVKSRNRSSCFTQGTKRSSGLTAASASNQVNRFLSPSHASLELRKLRIRETKTFPKATLKMICPMELKGLLVGSKCCHMNEIVKEYGVDIPRPNRDDSK